MCNHTPLLFPPPRSRNLALCALSVVDGLGDTPLRTLDLSENKLTSESLKKLGSLSKLVNELRGMGRFDAANVLERECEGR